MVVAFGLRNPQRPSDLSSSLQRAYDRCFKTR
jgi:hypothetical protein